MPLTISGFTVVKNLLRGTTIIADMTCGLDCIPACLNYFTGSMSARDLKWNAPTFAVAPAKVVVRLWLGAAAILISIYFPTPARAENTNNSDLTELSLEALMEIEVPKVSSASKFVQKATEAPAIVNVVTADEIKLSGYRTLADVLQSVPGFHVSNDRNYSFLGSQGISLGDFNSRTLLLVNGHRQNNNLTDGAYIDNTFILDLDLVDRIEIIQGPNAVLYGNNAFFGVINVVTRKPEQINGLEAAGEFGEFETYKGRISLGHSFTNGLALLLSGSFQNSGGAAKLFFPAYNTPAQHFGIADHLDAESAASSFGSLSYGDWLLEAAYNHREKDNPTAQYFTTFNAPGLKTTDRRGYVNLKYTHEFPKLFELSARASYDYAGHDLGYPFGSTGNTFYREEETGQWWGTELQLSKQIADKHRFTLGAEFRDDFAQDDVVSEPATGLTFTDSHRSRISYGIYGESELTLFKSLHLNSGVRYDQYGDFDAAVDPRVALIYSPLEKSTFKAIYGTAFRAPNFLELSDPRFQNIHPEEIRSYDLAYEQGIGRNLRSSLSGFYNQMNDLIVFENGSFGNVNAETKGLEFALEGNWASGLRGRASYTLQQAENLSRRQNLPDSPDSLIKFNLTAPLIKEKLFASVEIQYTSRRNTFSTTSTGQTLPGVAVNGYSTVNFTLFSQSLFKNLDLSASIYNLLGEQHADPATAAHLQSQIPQNGRSFRFKLTYRF
jgi:outer membrane receptor for ferrienterochelin and colicins